MSGLIIFNFETESVKNKILQYLIYGKIENNSISIIIYYNL